MLLGKWGDDLYDSLHVFSIPEFVQARQSCHGVCKR